MPILKEGEGGSESTTRLAVLVAKVWGPLIPPLDEGSLRLLKTYAVMERPLSLYKAAKAANMSFSLAYKKGSMLKSLRLLDAVDGTNYYVTIKGCIAGLARAGLSQSEFMKCIRRVWPVSSKELGDAELLSFLYVLGLVVARRRLDITKATICGFDESSLQIFKVYLNEVVARVMLGKRVSEAIEELAARWRAEPEVIINALKAAIKGVLSFIPPTLVTNYHKILATLNGGAIRPIAVVCNRKGCRYYDDTLGLQCPTIMRELLQAIREKQYSYMGHDKGG